VHRRGDGKRVAYMAPPPGSLPAADAAATVRAIVFPRYSEGAATSCRALSRAEALQRLLGQCLIVAAHLDTSTVRRLVGWIADLRCEELVFSALPDAVAAVARGVDGECENLTQCERMI
jgi:hypothetical protein